MTRRDTDRFGRYAEVLGSAGLVPFQRIPWVNPRTGRVEPRVLGERPAWHFRISPDEWALLVHEPDVVLFMFGFEVVVDETAPPGTVEMVPASASVAT